MRFNLILKQKFKYPVLLQKKHPKKQQQTNKTKLTHLSRNSSSLIFLYKRTLPPPKKNQIIQLTLSGILTGLLCLDEDGCFTGEWTRGLKDLGEGVE